MSIHGRARLTFTLALLVPAAALAWGANGHRIVGHIGEEYLTPEARAAVQAILGQDSLAEVATWPDDIRSDRDWRHAGPWHFISIDDDETFEGLERDDRGDILSKLGEVVAELESPDTDAETRWQAIAWLVHLVGDLHQPLHVGRRDDRGGNSVHVHWFDDSSNLHSVWDSGIIEHEGLSYTEYASFLDRPDAATAAGWGQGSFQDWAQESFDVRSQVYDFDRWELGYEYAYVKRPLLDRRLIQAGVRLGAVINRIYDGDGGD